MANSKKEDLSTVRDDEAAVKRRAKLTAPKSGTAFQTAIEREAASRRRDGSGK